MVEDYAYFDTDDYLSLAEYQRYILDQWLKDCGGDPPRTRAIRLFKDYIIVEEYNLTVKGKLTYDRKHKDVIVREVRYPLSYPPPVWKVIDGN